MKVFTKGSDYAVRILVFLAENARSGLIPSSVVAKETGIPIAFLRRIYSQLIKGGFLVASEGSQGGAKLARDPTSINTLEIIELIQGPIELSECVYKDQPCPNRDGCGIRRRILRIERAITDAFQAITIQSLIDDKYF